MIWGQKPTHRPVSAGVRQLVRTLFACSVLGRAEHLAFCEETAGQTVILLRLAAKVFFALTVSSGQFVLLVVHSSCVAALVSLMVPKQTV